MKSLSATVLTELQASGCKISTFIKLEIPSEDTLYLGGGDKTLSDGTTVEGRIINFPEIQTSVNWLNSDMNDGGFTIELANHPHGTAWETLVEQMETGDIHKITVSIITVIAREQIMLFKGYVEKIDSYTEKTMTISVRKGLGHVDTLLGTLLDDDTWGGDGVSDSARGKMMPLIWGKVENCPTIPVTGPWTATLLTPLTADITGTITFDDFEFSMNTGTTGYFFVGEELLKYRYLSYTVGRLQITERGAYHTPKAAHTIGSKAIQWGTEVIAEMLIAGHACASISDIKVDGVTAPTADYNDEPSKDLTTGWGGKKAQITYIRNPSYPDTSGSTKTKKIYFNQKVNGDTAEDTAKLLESTQEGDGPVSLDPALQDPGETVWVGISGRSWADAAQSLGTIKSVKLVIKHRTNFEPNRCDKKNGQINSKIYIKEGTGSFYGGYALPGAGVKDINAFIEEIIVPRSGKQFEMENTEFNPSHNGCYSSLIWNGDDTEQTAAEAQSEGGVGAVWAQAGADNYDWCNMIIDVRAAIPTNQNKGRHVTKLEMRTRTGLLATQYPSPTSPATINLIAYDADGNVLQRQRLAKTPNWYPAHSLRQSFEIDIMDYMEGTGTIQDVPAYIGIFFQTTKSGGTWWTCFHCASIDMVMTYLETNPTTHTTEYEAASRFNDWGDFDDAQVKITSADGVWYAGSWKQIDDIYFEVEYYPFRPFTEQKVTCTAVGRTPETSDYAHTGTVLQDIIENWLMDKTEMGGITLGSGFTGSYATDIDIGFRLDKQQSVISVLTLLAYEHRRWLTFDNLVWKMRFRYSDWSSQSISWAITDSDIVRSSMKVQNQSVYDLITNVKYKREYNYADSTWGYINEETATVIVGEKPMALNLYSVAKANPTFAAPALYLDCFSTVRKRYTFQVRAEGIKIENGDYITVTYSPLGIDTVRLLVLGVSYNLGDLLSGKPPIATITGIE